MPFDQMPLSFYMTPIIIAWTTLILVTLVTLRRAKVRRDKDRRLAIRAARRETHIQLAEESDPFPKEWFNK